MIRVEQVALAVMVAAALGGCTRLGLGDGPSFSSTSRAPVSYEPLTPAPTAPVTQGSLQPLPPPPGAPLDPNAPPAPNAQPVQPPPGPVASAAPVDAAKAPNVGRTELLGGWRVATGADNCQLFMNLTSWAGGYRAISKGCASPELQKISAWDLQGKTVTLKGSDGSTVATLVGAGGEKFSGRTSSSQPITLSR
ncbi:MAG: protease inhibitor Inh/omp19 family protein [Hyphomicrobiales bacterium]|nr:protease inhibitor Inh/omp19 family protein [Hyphomicrobiales bacterium]